MNKEKTNSPSATARDSRFKERFHYWRGQSGRRYIFSIYRPETCPPLPGAVYICVSRDPAGNRTARSIGRFAQFWEGGSGNVAAMVRAAGGNEIHVHLLAENDGDADATVTDLKKALSPAAVSRPAQTHAAHGARRQIGPAACKHAPEPRSFKQRDLFSAGPGS